MTLQAHRVRIKDVYFPNGGVYSITNEMRNGGLVEVATVGREGMLGIGVFFGDRDGIGRTFQQVANGTLPSMAAASFAKETTGAGPFRDIVSVYAQANLLQIMQCTACNALHNVTQRCCRWLLQTHDRVDDDTFVAQTGISCGDARRAPPDCHGGAAGAAARRVDREPLRTNPASSNESAWRPPLANATASFAPISYGSGYSGRREGAYRKRGDAAERLAMVHVCSHSRQRHIVVTVMTFASVSTILPLQNGQSVWRVTGPVNCVSGMCSLRSFELHAGGFVPVRLFKNEQPTLPPAAPRCAKQHRRRLIVTSGYRGSTHRIEDGDLDGTD